MTFVSNKSLEADTTISGRFQQEEMEIILVIHLDNHMDRASNKVISPKRFFDCILPFWQFLRNWLIGWIGQALSVQPSVSTYRKRPEMVVSASTNQAETKIISYAWSFAIQIQIEAV